MHVRSPLCSCRTVSRLCWDASAALAGGLRMLWDCGQRRRVAGTDVGEVAEVDGGHRDDRQPFAYRDHGGVGAAQVPVGVASHEFGQAPNRPRGHP
jgi:hypothetical protein